MRISLSRAAAGALGAAAVLAGMAGTAEAKMLRGEVVHHNRRGHSFVVANRAGHLYAIHAARAPRLRSEVVVRARRLRDGTYRLQREHRTGRGARRVRIRGVVSYVDRRTGAFTVSAPGVSMLVVHGRRRRAHVADTAPPVGTPVVATGTVDGQGELDDQSVQSMGTPTGGVDLEGTVLSVDQSAGTITVSADDCEQSGASVTVTVPSSLDITQFTPGEEVELIVQPTGTGTATLLGSADDRNAQTANSSGGQQGVNPGDPGRSSGDTGQPGSGGGDGQSSGSSGGNDGAAGGDH